MAFDPVLVGTTANDGTGDPLRTAFTRVNSNFGLAVEGATGSTDGNLVVFDGTSGKLVKDTGISFSSLSAGLTFRGTWNASTNTPTLTSSVGTNGDYYIVGTAGSTTLDGLSSWLVGDNVIFTNGVWTLYRPPAQVLVSNGTAGAPSVSFASDTNTGLFNPSADTLAASTNGVERVRIDSAGNVGIGTTSPTSKLEVTIDVASDIVGLVLNNSNASGGSIINIVRQSNTRAASIRYSLASTANWFTGVLRRGGSATGNYSVSTGSDISTTAPALSISTAGNVGIGTDAPTHFLDVNSNTIRIRTAQTPASNGTGTQGQIAWDADYIYVCTATNTWKRVALTGGY